MTKLVSRLALFALTAALASPLAQADWNKIISCEGGRAWIDVNSNSRTQLQFVNTIAEANRHMMNDLHASYDSWGGDSNTGNGELVWSGTQPQGVFAASDFEGATSGRRRGGSYASQYNGEWLLSFTEYASFFRISADQIKLQITRSDIQKCVNNQYDARLGRCAQGSHSVPDEYVGDWVFNDCR